MLYIQIQIQIQKPSHRLWPAFEWKPFGWRTHSQLSSNFKCLGERLIPMHSQSLGLNDLKSPLITADLMNTDLLIASNCVVWNDFCTIFDLIYWEFLDLIHRWIIWKNGFDLKWEQHMQNEIISWWIEK